MTNRVAVQGASLGSARSMGTAVPTRALRPLVHPLAALILSALGGILLSWSFPEPGWWWLAPVGVAAMLIALVGRSGTGALAVGGIGGLTLFGSLIQWATLFLGLIPYGALVVLMAAFCAIGAVLIARAYAWLPRRWPGRVGRFVALPLAVGGLWTLREAIASTWPYGGFAWGRVAQSQSASPLGDLVSWLGLSGLSFVIVTLTALAIEVARVAVERLGDERWRRDARIRFADARAGTRARAAAGALAAGSAIALLAAVPVFPSTTTGTMRIGAVQGNTPEAAYFIPGEPGDILNAHLEATYLIDPDAWIDVILWPEGSVDVSPLYSQQVAARLSALSAEYDAPIVGNTVTVTRGETEAGDEYFNTQFVWTSDGWAEQTVDKVHPIPFGEYVPDRDFWYALAPDLVGLIQRGYTPGEQPATMEVAGVNVGVLICYDVVDDGVIREAMFDGGEVLFAPTNNADFGDTDELPQQLAFARLRAMETGRAVVQISTVGDSAVYLPDGRELAAIPSYEAGVMVVEVPLSDTITPGVALGQSIEWFTAGLGVVLLLGARIGARSSRKRVDRTPMWIP